MLMRIKTDTVVSDQGFSVCRDDVYTVSYHEGNRVFKFGLELCGPGQDHDLILYSDSSLSRTWQPPYECEPLGSVSKETIVARVVSALVFMGKRVLVV